MVDLLQDALLSPMYLGIAVYLAPRLTVLVAVLLGGITYVIRIVVEPAYSVGNRVADANERIQSVVQTGTQLIEVDRHWILMGWPQLFFSSPV